MIKTYLLEDLDCAHCAAKIEQEVSKIEGVIKSNCIFLTSKLIVEVEDDKVQKLSKQINRIVKKIEPDVTVIEK